MRIFILAVSSFLLSACATPIPEAETQAAKTFAARCSGCHALPHPARHRAGQWPHILSLMEQRMRERAYAPMTDQERDEILAYLQRNAR